MDDGSDPGNAPASPGRPPRPRVALAAKLAVAAASLAASLIAVELVYRAFRRGLYQARVGEWGTDLYRLEPPPRYYSCLPDLDLTATFAHEHGESRATYRTDGDGWRRQPEVAVGTATRGVVCLGDSYTFGIAVDDDGTHPWQLQEILRADLAAGAFGLSFGLEYSPGRYSASPSSGRWARRSAARAAW